ncbi:MAG TPA: hypothetical protein DE060_17580 [Lentisphaeria bacterium]|nr:hypothetical protein [Lentisphaeria bacterium]
MLISCLLHVFADTSSCNLQCHGVSCKQKWVCRCFNCEVPGTFIPPCLFFIQEFRLLSQVVFRKLQLKPTEKRKFFNFLA